jgi:uncharacterized membrane protein YdjX (TVP38/TMEM64 family)
MLTNTFAGISPIDVPAFMLAQSVGGFLGWVLYTILHADHLQQHDRNR